MNYSDQTKKRCLNTISQLQLPASFHKTVTDIYLPLAALIIQKKKNQPLFVSINGAQGTGKSTLTVFLKLIIESELNCPVATLSLDDFYYTRAQRQQLANNIHPLFITRGVPGTHDLAMMKHVLQSLLAQENCSIPKFNKAIDDRCDQADWQHCQTGTEFILFEGWCNSSPAQTTELLATPINELEEKEDPHAIWRTYANDQLINYHKQLFDLANVCLILQAPDFEHIYDWRRLQEQKLRHSTKPEQQSRILNDAELHRFIMHYERITRHTLAYLPHTADLVLPIAADHTITDIIDNKG